MSTSRPDDVALAAEVDRRVGEQRIACLWFLRPDFKPVTTAERIRVLDQDDSLLRLGPADLVTAIAGGRLRSHRGSMRGTLPRLVGSHEGG